MYVYIIRPSISVYIELLFFLISSYGEFKIILLRDDQMEPTG